MVLLEYNILDFQYITYEYSIGKTKEEFEVRNKCISTMSRRYDFLIFRQFLLFVYREILP